MDQRDLDRYRKLLLEERSNLLVELQNEDHDFDQYTDINPDIFDLADRDLYAANMSGRVELLIKWLMQIEVALKRIEDGIYGNCKKCGRPINPERLNAVPYVIYCITCKEMLENSPELKPENRIR